MRLVVVAALFASGGLAGCSTFDRGTTDEVYALSDPAGAKVTVSFAETTCFAPCKFEVSRASPFFIYFTKDGYDPQQVEVTTRSTALEQQVSRDVTADYVGRIADFQDGSHLIHVPNPVSVKLVKTAPPAE